MIPEIPAIQAEPINVNSVTAPIAIRKDILKIIAPNEYEPELKKINFLNGFAAS